MRRVSRSVLRRGLATSARATRTDPLPAKGLFAPVLVPVDQKSLAPDVPRLLKRSQALLKDGCHGLVVFGTTGEANSFSVAQRQMVLAAMREAGIPADKVMVGTGCCSVADTLALTKHSLELGYSNVLVLPPFYYKNVGDDGLFASYARLLDSIGASNLGLYLYHIPQLSFAPISVALIKRLRAQYPKNIVGIKDSTGDFKNTKLYLDAFPGWGTFCGTEQVMTQTLKHGGAGCITATANLFSKQLRQLHDSFASDKDGALEKKVLALCQTVRSRTPIPAMKELLAHDLKDAAWRTVLPPLTQMAAEDVAKLVADVQAARSTL